MKQVITLSLVTYILILSGCAGTHSRPAIDSGLTVVETRHFKNLKTRVKVETVTNYKTKEIVYDVNKRESFSGNSIKIPNGVYSVSAYCESDTSLGSVKSKARTWKYDFKAGNIYRLRLKVVHTIKDGTHCRPQFYTE